MSSQSSAGDGVSHPRRSLALLLALTLSAAALTGGCSPAEEPVRDAREALGTIVTVTAYGEDAEAIEASVDVAFDEMAAVERALNVYESESSASVACGTAASMNLMPYEWNPLPQDAQAVLERTAELGVGGQFSPALYGVQELYEFESGGRVPEPEELDAAVASAGTFETREANGIVDARFAPAGEGTPASDTAGASADEETPPVGVDFGGAAKGLGLDRAVAVLLESGSVDAAIVSAGSTTIAVGEKPDGTSWRIGIEDPRDPEAVVSVVESMGDVVVSTSGDYQRYFEHDGERYHHILHPDTGLPARGTRSLTVVGTDTGLDSDILSTALFVMGPDPAMAYAEERGLGLYVIDSEGRTQIAPGPADSYTFEDAE
jgi:thiamine biosynthesis lipoprotein